MTIVATPSSARSVDEGALGVLLTSDRRPATFGETIKMGTIETGMQTALVAYLPIALIQQVINPADARLVSVIGIGKIVQQAFVRDVKESQQAKTAGPSSQPPTNWLLNIIAMLSISLGVMNLLPVPALDGGRILFAMPEILFRKRIKPEFENVINGVVMMMLLAFMVFTMVRDLFTLDSIGLP